MANIQDGTQSADSFATAIVQFVNDIFTKIIAAPPAPMAAAKFGVAQRSKTANDCHQHQRQRQCWARTWPAKRGMVPDHEIEQGRIQDGRGVEFLSGDRRADHGKNARANHRANAQGR